MKNRWIICRSSWSGQAIGENDRTGKNPARGFYRVYTYDLTEQEAEEDWVWSLQKDERLALVLLDIGKCADRALSDEELAKAARIFSLFRAHQMQMIVRVVYDRHGHGMEREPDTMSQICVHMRQLGPVLAAFSSDIFTVQGLFIGSWGEMHDSRYLAPEQLCLLYETLREVTAGSVCISVRKPQFQRVLTESDGGVRTGLYDDAVMGSETDMGTFGWIDDCTDPQIMWTPRHELAFIEKQAAHTPVGGEVLSGALICPWKDAFARMRRMHLTCLNRVHEPAVWEAWSASDCTDPMGNVVTKEQCLRAYLGYRYVLSDIRLQWEGAQGMQIMITLQNCGFACCYDRLRMEFVVGKKRLQAFFDGKTLAAGGKLVVTYSLEDALRGQEKDMRFPLVLALYHEKTGLPIYFANECPDDIRWEKYRQSSSLSEGIAVGVLSTVKDAAS